MGLGEDNIDYAPERFQFQSIRLGRNLLWLYIEGFSGAELAQLTREIVVNESRMNNQQRHLYDSAHDTWLRVADNPGDHRQHWAARYAGLVNAGVMEIRW